MSRDARSPSRRSLPMLLGLLLVAVVSVALTASCATRERATQPWGSDRARFAQWQDRGVSVAVTPSGDADSDELLRALLEATRLFSAAVIAEPGTVPRDVEAVVLGTIVPRGSERPRPDVLSTRFMLRKEPAVLVISDGGARSFGDTTEAEERARLAVWLSVEIVRSALHRSLFPDTPRTGPR